MGDSTEQTTWRRLTDWENSFFLKGYRSFKFQVLHEFRLFSSLAKDNRAIPYFIDKVEKASSPDKRAYFAFAISNIIKKEPSSPVALEHFSKLIGFLNDKDEWVRHGLVGGIIDIVKANPGNSSMLEAFIPLCKHNGIGSDYSMRLGKAIKSIGEPAIPLLIELLKDADPEIRYRSLCLMKEIGSRSAVPEIINALSDPSERVRFQAANSFQEICGIDSFPVICASLFAEKDEGVRKHAGVVLSCAIYDCKTIAEVEKAESAIDGMKDRLQSRRKDVLEIKKIFSRLKEEATRKKLELNREAGLLVGPAKKPKMRRKERQRSNARIVH